MQWRHMGISIMDIMRKGNFFEGGWGEVDSSNEGKCPTETITNRHF